MLESYSLLRQDFLSLAEPSIDNDVLNQLKCNYAHDINSKRKLSEVKDLKAFIRLLEKRDVISYKNIEQLRFISKTFVGKSELDVKLLDYENCLETTQLSPSYNLYRSDKGASESLQQQGHTEEHLSSLLETACTSTCNLSQPLTQNSTISSSHVLQSSYQQKEKDNADDKRKLVQQAVLQEIKDRLGRSWRDIARRLSIRECEIDAIQNKYPYDLKKQSGEFLEMYMTRSDTERWAINLIHALENGRRRDLKEHVEELILKNNT